jgi:xanthine dehydrogenase accessory factor
VIFGAGHVSHALCKLLESSPLELAVVDDRPEWNSPERFPHARRITSWDEGTALVIEHRQSTLACVMTCSHDRDLALVQTLLERPPAFLGLIGSRSKRACFFSRLAGAGFDETAVQKVRCPIGVGDTGKEPHAVAISIAAQLLIEAKALASA